MFVAVARSRTPKRPLLPPFALLESDQVVDWTQKPGRSLTHWKYSMVWACVGSALLGGNSPKEVISALLCVSSYSLLNKELSLSSFSSPLRLEFAGPLLLLLLLLTFQQQEASRGPSWQGFTAAAHGCHSSNSTLRTTQFQTHREVLAGNSREVDRVETDISETGLQCSQGECG